MVMADGPEQAHLGDVERSAQGPREQVRQLRARLRAQAFA